MALRVADRQPREAVKLEADRIDSNSEDLPTKEDVLKDLSKR